ncbi:hypothetical protein AVEN_191155-1 [Araneus ventricosus]|uniref:Uncharacterized protein n=1 Tax=Araneus ventricosus TaxID=182803 RepID=A0A4Y2AXW8_ARAVE|nr:hypothetical protein AVEN_191155-1 [Araneus ventricosus]
MVSLSIFNTGFSHLNKRLFRVLLLSGGYGQAKISLSERPYAYSFGFKSGKHAGQSFRAIVYPHYQAAPTEYESCAVQSNIITEKTYVNNNDGNASEKRKLVGNSVSINATIG